jgi:exodeoxyribonuclease-3
MIKLISWNVNGLRSVIAKGALAPLAAARPDVICLQEIKAREDQVGQVLPDYPYQYFSTTKKPGYSGTAILSRFPAASWHEGMGHGVSDDEGRVVTVEFASLTVVSVYVPNSQRGLPRLGVRLEWDAAFRAYVKKLARKKPVVFSGDMNVAHEEIDIARPDDNHRNAGFTDEERASFTQLLDAGFIDTFRTLHAEGDRYTWWSLITRARERNIGWRIDYVCVSQALREKLRDAFILESLTGSDHCPIGVVLDGEL